MRPGTAVITIVAILIGGLAAFFARSIILSSRPSAQMASTTKIVVASRPLGFGAALAVDNLMETPWPADAVPDGSFTSIESLTKDGTRVALSQIARNEPILASRVTAPGQKASLSTLIEPGKRAVTVRVDDVRGVAGFVMPGDRIDVVLTRTERKGPDRTDSYSDVLLHNVKVLAIDQLANERQEKAQVAKAVTLEVTAEQGQKLILAGGAGTLSLILREAGGGKGEGDRARRLSLIDLETSDGAVAESKEAEPSPPSQSSSVQVIRRASVEQMSVYRDTH
jgi:pilus assembly protein CpaB